MNKTITKQELAPPEERTKRIKWLMIVYGWNIIMAMCAIICAVSFAVCMGFLLHPLGDIYEYGNVYCGTCDEKIIGDYCSGCGISKVDGSVKVSSHCSQCEKRLLYGSEDAYCSICGGEIMEESYIHYDDAPTMVKIRGKIMLISFLICAISGAIWVTLQITV